jgi:hypothetical protein
MISFYVLWIVVISSASFGGRDYVAETGIYILGHTMKRRMVSALCGVALTLVTDIA